MNIRLTSLHCFVAALFVCTAAALSSCSSTKDNSATVITKTRKFPNVDSLVRTSPLVLKVSSSATTALAQGVKLTDMDITIPPSLSGETENMKEKIHIVAIDPYKDGINIRTATPNNSVAVPTGKWPHQSLSGMAKALDTPSAPVLAMVNADFWNTTTQIAVGPLHCNGTVIKSTFEPLYKKQGISFIGVSKSKVMAIEHSSEYERLQNVYPNLTGSGIILVWNGKDVDNSGDSDKERHPRTAIGYTSDNHCFFLTVDGRSTASKGMTMDDMGSIFSAMGCVAAVNLDGGGSTMLLVRDPSDGALKIWNTPSDGKERAVIDAWVVTGKPE